MEIIGPIVVFFSANNKNVPHWCYLAFDDDGVLSMQVTPVLSSGVLPEYQPDAEMQALPTKLSVLFDPSIDPSTNSKYCIGIRDNKLHTYKQFGSYITSMEPPYSPNNALLTPDSVSKDTFTISNVDFPTVEWSDRNAIQQQYKTWLDLKEISLSSNTQAVLNIIQKIASNDDEHLNIDFSLEELTTALPILAGILNREPNYADVKKQLLESRFSGWLNRMDNTLKIIQQILLFKQILIQNAVAENPLSPVQINLLLESVQTVNMLNTVFYVLNANQGSIFVKHLNDKLKSIILNQSDMMHVIHLASGYPMVASVMQEVLASYTHDELKAMICLEDKMTHATQYNWEYLKKNIDTGQFSYEKVTSILDNFNSMELGAMMLQEGKESIAYVFNHLPVDKTSSFIEQLFKDNWANQLRVGRCSYFCDFVTFLSAERQLIFINIQSVKNFAQSLGVGKNSLDFIVRRCGVKSRESVGVFFKALGSDISEASIDSIDMLVEHRSFFAPADIAKIAEKLIGKQTSLTNINRLLKMCDIDQCRAILTTGECFKTWCLANITKSDDLFRLVDGLNIESKSLIYDAVPDSILQKLISIENQQPTRSDSVYYLRSDLSETRLAQLQPAAPKQEQAAPAASSAPYSGSTHVNDMQVDININAAISHQSQNVDENAPVAVEAKVGGTAPSSEPGFFQTQSATTASSASTQDNVLVLQEEITRQLDEKHSNYPPEFKNAITEMAQLIVSLNNKGELITLDAISLMALTKELIGNPQRHHRLLTDAKRYETVAGGELSAYMMLIAGWAARIVTFGYKGNEYIDRANKKLEQIKTVKTLASESKNESEARTRQGR